MIFKNSTGYAYACRNCPLTWCNGWHVLHRFETPQLRACSSMASTCGAVPGRRQQGNYWTQPPSRPTASCQSYIWPAGPRETNPSCRMLASQPRSIPVPSTPVEITASSPSWSWTCTIVAFLPRAGPLEASQLQYDLTELNEPGPLFNISHDLAYWHHWSNLTPFLINWVIHTWSLKMSCYNIPVNLLLICRHQSTFFLSA